MVVKEKFHKNDTINNPLLSKAVQTALDNTNSFACMVKELGYRVLDVTKTFYVDVLILDDDTYIVSYPDKITSKPCTIEDNFGCIIDFSLKEETAMATKTTKEMFMELINNGYSYNRALTPDEIVREYNNMLEELALIDDVNSGTDIVEAINKSNNIINKEESIMTQMTKDTIRKELKIYGIELSDAKFNKTKKEALMAMLNEAKAKANATQEVQENAIDKLWNENTATKVLNNIMAKAKKNKCINFISHHMATSAICEVIVGKSLKDPKTKIDNEFSDDEKKLVAEFRERFSEKYLIINSRGTGYNIKAVALVWYYKKVVYRYHDKIKSRNIDYIVDFRTKTITRVDDNNKVTTLDSKAFEILDSTCVFIKVCNN